MESEQLEIGTLTFRIEVPKEIGPGSSLAKKIAGELVSSLNYRLFEAARRGVIRYSIRSQVSEVRAGCLFVTLQLYADVIFATGAVAAALAKFVGDYPKIREGVLAIGRDIKEIRLKSFAVFERKFATHVEEESLVAEERVPFKAAVVEEKVRLAKLAEEASRLAAEKAAEQQSRTSPVRRGRPEPMA